MINPGIRLFWKPVLKIIASLTCLVVLFRSIHPDEVWSILVDAQAWTLSLGLVLASGCILLQVGRWRILCIAEGYRLPYGLAAKLLWIGYFFSQILPSTVGGDAVRLWQVSRLGMPISIAFGTIVADRVFGITVMALLVLAASPWLLDAASGRPEIVSVLVLAGGVFAVGVLIGLFTHHFCGMLKAKSLARFSAPISSVGRICRDILTRPGATALVLAYSVLVFVLYSLVASVAAHSIGISLPLSDSLKVIPAVLLMSAIPISVAGWGIREGAMVVALGIFGIAPAQALAISILLGLNGAIISLPGAMLWWSLQRHCISSNRNTGPVSS